MNAHICMQTHRESLATGIRWQARTKTHTLWETSNSRAYISLKIHAANAGARACCFLDISLPKGLYFILPSNPMSPQFSHSHIFFSPSLPRFLSLKHLKTSLRIWPQRCWAVKLLVHQCASFFLIHPCILCSVERARFRPGNFFFYQQLLWSSLLRYSRSHTLTLLWTYF